MKIEKTQYLTIKDEIIEHSDSYVTNEKIERFKLHIEEKVNNFNPTIMVYGIYNAGKSTLLNALFGKYEMAKTGDAPETAIVSGYEYNGYTIYDTPGVNAPQEHELVTAEHRAKCEVVLFVISNDGSFEDEYVYEKIGEIIKEKKPILIVVNNKTGINMQSEDAGHTIMKVNTNLVKICDRMGIQEAETKVDVMFVDAKTALDGKLENEEELIENSNIRGLEAKIDEMLGSAGSKAVENTLNLYMKNFITEVIYEIDSKIDNPKIQKTEQLITYFEKLKQKTYTDLNSLIQDSTNIVIKNLINMLAQKDNNVNDMVQKTITEIQEQISQKLETVQKEIQDKTGEFKCELEKLIVENEKFNMPDIESNKQNSSDSNNNKEMIVGAGSAAIALIPPTLVIPTPIPIPVKLVAQFVLTIFAIFSGSNKERDKAQERLNEQRNQHLVAKTSADEFGFKYKNQLLENVNTNIFNIFSKLIGDYEALSVKLGSENSQLKNDKLKLQEIMNRLD